MKQLGGLLRSDNPAPLPFQLRLFSTVLFHHIHVLVTTCNYYLVGYILNLIALTLDKQTFECQFPGIA